MLVIYKDERTAHLAVHQHSPTPASRLTKQVPRELGPLPNALLTKHRPATSFAAHPVPHREKYFQNVLGAGIGVAARRDFGALSATSGLGYPAKKARTRRGTRRCMSR